MLTDDNNSEVSTVVNEARKPTFVIPSDFKDEQEFLNQMRKDFFDDTQFDRLNREAALEDLQFAVGDQWLDYVRQRREAAGKPVLTVNRLPAFIAQIVGARRQNETEIKIIPDSGGTIAIARVREGLIRSIQKISRAEIAYDKALENAVICGIGNFQLSLREPPDDPFKMEIGVDQIPDALSVVWDRTMFDPSGCDAKHVFVIDVMPIDEYKKRWPWATPADVVTDVTLRGDIRMNGWISVEDVRVVSYHRMRTRKKTLALMNDGSTRDITEEADAGALESEGLLGNIVVRDDGTPIMREVQSKYCETYLCSGTDILAGPQELPIGRVPVFRVPGWEIYVGEWKHRWGLTRFLKDPQRLHNYSRSMWAEKMMQTPRAVWLARFAAVAGREKDFRAANLSDDPLLIYNDDAAEAPQRIPPAQIEQAWIGLSEQTTQDIKDVSNIHEANLGMPSNEVSGAAIMARQRVSDTGTILYHDNLTQAIEQCGIVIDQLIPYIYDAPRIIKVLGNDAKQDMQVINDTGNPKSVDITAGKYSVTVQNGPAFATRRIESLAAMQGLANAAPQLVSMFADYYVAAIDMPFADKIAERIRMSMPPQLLRPEEITPEIQQKSAAQAAQQQQQIKMAMLQAMSEWQKTQSEIALNSARAQNFEAQSNTASLRANTEAVNVASQAAEREMSAHLDAIRLGGGK